MIRVVLVDDQTLAWQGIRSLLELAGDIAIVAEAEDGEQALAAIAREKPDLVLLDVRMPRKNGLEVLRDLKASGSLPPVILLTTFDDDEALIEGEGRRAGILAEGRDARAVDRGDSRGRGRRNRDPSGRHRARAPRPRARAPHLRRARPT
jgi:CheY-like chemotaxis protein